MGVSPAVTGFEHRVASGGYIDRQDADSAACDLANQPDNNNNSSNSFQSTSTLADDPGKRDKLLEEKEATK